jgi:hypothetical protein
VFDFVDAVHLGTLFEQEFHRLRIGASGGTLGGLSSEDPRRPRWLIPAPAITRGNTV